MKGILSHSAKKKGKIPIILFTLFSSHFVPKAGPVRVSSYDSGAGSYNTKKSPVLLDIVPGKGGPERQRVEE